MPSRPLVPTLLALAACATVAPAQTAVVPTTLAATEGGGNYAFSTAGGLTFQQVVSPSALAAAGILPGSQLNAIHFRANGNATTSPALTFSTISISLGQANFAPGSLGTNLSGNQGADTVTARSGALSIPANSFPEAGVGPNLFGPAIGFTTPYTYTGGNLLITISQSASSANLAIDAGNSSQLSATDYQSRQGSFGGTTVGTNNGAFFVASQFDYTTTAVPEPASALAAAGFGLGVVGVRRRRRLLARVSPTSRPMPVTFPRSVSAPTPWRRASVTAFERSRSDILVLEQEPIPGLAEVVEAAAVVSIRSPVTRVDAPEWVVGAFAEMRIDHADIAARVVRYARGFPAQFRRDSACLRVETVATATCPQFHCDNVRMRMVCTLYGRGTEYVMLDDPGEVLHAQEGALVFLKGRRYPKHAHAVHHRSSTLHPGEKRLCLVLDF